MTKSIKYKDQEEAKKFQELAIKRGFKWPTGGGIVVEVEEEYLFFVHDVAGEYASNVYGNSGNKIIMYGDTKDMEEFGDLVNEEGLTEFLESFEEEESKEG